MTTKLTGLSREEKTFLLRALASTFSGPSDLFAYSDKQISQALTKVNSQTQSDRIRKLSMALFVKLGFHKNESKVDSILKKFTELKGFFHAG